MERIRKYEQVYRTINDDTLSYIKVINLSSKVICNKIHGRTQHRILAFLMSLHVVERPVWLVRPGPVDVDPSLYMGSCHPGVVAHQLHSPKLHPADLRHQSSGRPRGVFGQRPAAGEAASSLGTSRTGLCSPHSALTPSTSHSSLAAVSPRQGPSSPETADRQAAESQAPHAARTPAQVGNLENDDMFSAVEPIEPPEMALSEDEDDYWGSFKGIASWQRVVAKEHTAAMEARATGAAGQAAAQHTYSWPLPSAAGAPPVTARMPPQRSAAMPRK